MLSYSKDMQDRWESVPYAASFTPSALVSGDARGGGVHNKSKSTYRRHSAVALLWLFLVFFYLDELIRQMTVNCAERGLLLFRIGDEIQTTVATYKTLYESSIAFGIRKTLLAEQGKADMEKRVKDLNFTT